MREKLLQTFILIAAFIGSVPVAKAQGNLVIRANDLTRMVGFIVSDTPKVLEGITALSANQKFEPVAVSVAYKRPESLGVKQELFKHEERLLFLLRTIPVHRETAISYLAACGDLMAPALALAILPSLPPITVQSVQYYFVRQDNELFNAIVKEPKQIENELIRMKALERVPDNAYLRELAESVSPRFFDPVEQIMISHMLRPELTMAIEQNALLHAIGAAGIQFPARLRNLYFGSPEQPAYSIEGGRAQLDEIFDSLPRAAKMMLTIAARASDSWRNAQFIVPSDVIKAQLKAAKTVEDKMGVIAVNVRHLRLSLAPFVYQGSEGLSLLDSKRLEPRDVEGMGAPLRTLQLALNQVSRLLPQMAHVFQRAVDETLNPSSMQSSNVNVPKIRDEIEELIDFMNRVESGSGR